MTILTALEARALFDHESAAVKRDLDLKIAPIIAKAARAGETQAIFHIDAEPRLPVPSIRQTNIITELRKLGYTVYFDSYGESYVPRAHADDAGGGPMYRNYGFVIRW